MKHYVKDLNYMYKDEKSLYELDNTYKGFDFIDLKADAEFATEFNAAPKKAGVNNIKCSACHCKHNDHQKCYAEDVQINHVTASCETFEQH